MTRYTHDKLEKESDGSQIREQNNGVQKTKIQASGVHIHTRPGHPSVKFTSND